MQCLENIAVSSSTNREAYLTKIEAIAQPKLFMVWVKKTDETGRERLVAEWKVKN